MIVLGLETSCDETAASILSCNRSKIQILSNIVASQLIHSRFGGVVPEIAARTHMRLIVPISKLALRVAKKSLNDIDLIAVTYGPGLLGSLLVGLSFAKGLVVGHRIPFIGINHIEGHIFSILLDHPGVRYPYLALIISGGHTELILVHKKFHYQILGSTLDDACGEAFDKVAKMLSLPYPGGPHVERLARQGNEKVIPLPMPKIKDYDFSFSGLKTAVLYYLRNNPKANKKDICAKFQKIVTDFLIQKTLKASMEFKCKRLGIAGGVSANGYLRARLKKELGEKGLKVYIPSLPLSTDNAAMIAICGYERILKFPPSSLTLPVFARFEGFN